MSNEEKMRAILLNHGFRCPNGEGIFTHEPTDIEIWPGETWDITVSNTYEGGVVRLPNLNPDNLITLLHILGIKQEVQS